MVTSACALCAEETLGVTVMPAVAEPHFTSGRAAAFNAVPCRLPPRVPAGGAASAS